MCSLAFNLQFFTRCATYEFAFGISFDYQHVFIFFSVKKNNSKHSCYWATHPNSDRTRHCLTSLIKIYCFHSNYCCWSATILLLLLLLLESVCGVAHCTLAD